MDLKIPLIKNKRNNQFNFSIPKRKLSKEFVKELSAKKYIELKLEKKKLKWI